MPTVQYATCPAPSLGNDWLKNPNQEWSLTGEFRTGYGFTLLYFHVRFLALSRERMHE